MNTFLNRILLCALLLALVVVVLGAYVRLSDAGLGCPDWPGCYGILVGVPDSAEDIHAANSEYERPVEVHKAWKEVIHRYFAGTLGILIFIISILLLRRDKQGETHRIYALVLASLLIFQALLGMWTVTLQLKPLIVMGHLLGGFTLFNMLGWQWLRTLQITTQRVRQANTVLVKVGVFAIVVLACQIALGGWVSSNYAALACVDFPTCQQQWWPDMDLKNGFILWRGLGVDYEFGVLENPARVAIHMVHRAGAAITALVLIYYALRLFFFDSGFNRLRAMACVILTALAAQLTLGILNVVLHLPLAIAVMHNGVALLLMFSIVSSVYMLKYKTSTNLD
jgi:cytochrome c oxidase assembly protein subunit 15